MNAYDPQEVTIKKIQNAEVMSDDQNDHTETPELELCPECQTPLLCHSFFANGEDDYDQMWECKGCGFTAST